MKIPFVTAVIALAALLAFAAPSANAQTRPVGGGLRITLPSHSNHFSWEGSRHGRHGGLGSGVWIVEREVPVIVEREVVREVVAPTPSPSPEGEGKRKPYVIGSTYASLPGGCMKLVEEGGKATYYYCSGDWYRQVGEGRAVSYRAVKREL